MLCPRVVVAALSAFKSTSMDSPPRPSRSCAGNGNEEASRDCEICFYELERPETDDPELTAYTLQCHPDHTFHRKCINEWVLTSPSCPNCRAEVGCTNRGELERQLPPHFRGTPPSSLARGHDDATSIACPWGYPGTITLSCEGIDITVRSVECVQVREWKERRRYCYDEFWRTLVNIEDMLPPAVLDHLKCVTPPLRKQYEDLVKESPLRYLCKAYGDEQEATWRRLIERVAEKVRRRFDKLKWKRKGILVTYDMYAPESKTLEKLHQERTP